MSALQTADDYAGALRALMPRGRVWPSEPGTGQAAVLACLAQWPERLDQASIDLIADAFPASTTDLVTEWEETLGLPDPCLGPSPTLEQRRDQIVARLTGTGGQTAQSFIDFAATLGFVVTITSFAPFRTGRSRVGQPLNGPDWAHAWLVTILSGATSADHAAFRVGQNRTGDALASSSTAVAALECELRRIAPAHTTIIFSF